MAEQIQTQTGLEFILPESISGKRVSVVEVGPFNESSLAEEINRFLSTSIENMNRVDAYILVHDKDIQGLENLLTGKPFVDPIIQRGTLNSSLALQLGLDFDYVLQSMLNPGTSDAQGNVALQQALLALGKEVREGDYGFYSKQFFLKSNSITSQQLEEVSAFLANPDLNKRVIIPRQEYEKGRKVLVPVVTLEPKAIVETFDITNMTDEQLLKLNSERKIAASLEEMQQFRDRYKDERFIEERRKYGLDEKATDVDLETWFGLRSEHCFHKEFNAHLTIEDRVNDPIFRRAFEKGWLTRDSEGNYVLENGLFKKLIVEPARAIYDKLEKRGKNWIVSMFEDNSGVVYYDENFMFCIKFETHNSPSNKEPVQGAKTGIDGVNRDIFGTMRGTFDAIANFFFYCTGDPHYKGWLPRGVKHPYMVLKGITQGVREGGNESQIPTLGGGLITDPRSIAKVLLFAGTVGWSPVRSPDGRSYLGKIPKIGDIIFVAGQPVGIDGVHGATESSLHASEYISLGHVQADFSFIQAKMKEWILECSRNYLFTDITDCGAMGLGSASHEMANSTGGLELELASHPIKYRGIQPWQINCSETQDRMVFAADPKDTDEILRRANLHDVQATPLGKLTDSGYVQLRYEGKTVALIDIKKLFNKEPRKRMRGTWNMAFPNTDPEIKENYSLEQSLCLVMEQPDVASKEWFFRQKDSSVKGATIQSPLIGLNQEVEADATIQKPLDTEGKDFGAIAYALGITPKASDIDPYHSAQRSFIDMVGKIIAIGGALPDMETPKWDAWAVCGNYCQPNSESTTTLRQESGEHNLASLVREAIGIREAIEATNIPVISGKDSMKCSCIYEVDSSFNLDDIPPDLRRHITLSCDIKTGKRKIEIHDPDSYLASCAVKIEDHRKCVSSALKQKDDMIYVIGTTRKHLASSQYYNALGYKENGAPLVGGEVPKVDLEEFVKVAKAVHSAIDNELVASCSYVHNGGIIAALAKAALAGEKGAEICSIHGKGIKDTYGALYSETPGRFIVTISREDKHEFESLLGSVPFELIGTVEDSDELHFYTDCGNKETVSLEKVKQSYQKPLRFNLDVVKK